MCRLAAHAGIPRPLSSLLYDPPHSLEVQSYRPRSMVSGHVNVDGTGLVWWPRAGKSEPLRYVTAAPPWSDPNLPSLAPRLEAAIQIAAVRSATPGMPFGAGAIGPFTADGLGFAHNGYVEDFERATARALLDMLPDADFATTAIRTDSTALFALVLAARRDSPCAGPGAWQLTSTARSAGVRANLACVLCDGERIAALRTSVDTPPNTLHAHRDESGLRLASEPLDDATWQEIPPTRILEMDVSAEATDVRSPTNP
jgi:glutamine amidotransferase